MEYLNVLGGIAGVFLLACLSPGPVWLVITSTSASVSRRAGVLTGLGVAGATLTWATVTMLGLGLMLARLAWLSTGIKFAGATYLIWIGARMIVGAHRPGPIAGSPAAAARGGWSALRRGYLASITNPKAAAFFGSVFAVMLPTQAPGWVSAAAVVMLSSLSALWHSGLALIFSVASIQVSYRRLKGRIDRAVGAILITLGIGLAASR